MLRCRRLTPFLVRTLRIAVERCGGNWLICAGVGSVRPARTDRFCWNVRIPVGGAQPHCRVKSVLFLDFDEPSTSSARAGTWTRHCHRQEGHRTVLVEGREVTYLLILGGRNQRSGRLRSQLGGIAFDDSYDTTPLCSGQCGSLFRSTPPRLFRSPDHHFAVVAS